METRDINPEEDILFDITQSLPRKAVDGIVGAVAVLLGNAEQTGTEERAGKYASRFRVRQEVGGTVTTVEAEVAYVRFGEQGYETRGFSASLRGTCTDGMRTYSSEGTYTVGGLRGDGSMAELVALIESHGPTDWLYSHVEMFCEGLREDLDEYGEPVGQDRITA